MKNKPLGIKIIGGLDLLIGLLLIQNAIVTVIENMALSEKITGGFFVFCFSIGFFYLMED